MQDIKKRIQLLNKQILSKKDLEIFLKKIPENTSIYDLTRDGKILQVIKRDAYYLNTLGLKIANPFVIGATYCEYKNYVFGGLALYNRYGFTTQVANKYTIYTTEYYGTKKILNSFYSFKKVKKEMIYNYKEKMIDGIFVRIMTPERAFIEFCRENKNKINSLREIYSTKIDKQLFENILKKYPYQNIRQFIQKEIILGK